MEAKEFVWQRCREISSDKLQAIWARSNDVQQAVLDRAFIHPGKELSSSLAIAWNRTVFNHALITVRLPHSTSGIGYAGACRADSASPRVPRCRIDLKQWNRKREEWARLLTVSLAQEDDAAEEQPPDPYQALANGELIAEAIAYDLAPKRIPRTGEIRSFCFPGHRLLFRDLNLLRADRVLVDKVFRRADDFCQSPHREVRWSVNVLRLNHGVRRSGYPCPLYLEHPLPSFLRVVKAHSALTGWSGSGRRGAVEAIGRAYYPIAWLAPGHDPVHQLPGSGAVLAL